MFEPGTISSHIKMISFKKKTSCEILVKSHRNEALKLVFYPYIIYVKCSGQEHRNGL